MLTDRNDTVWEKDDFIPEVNRIIFEAIEANKPHRWVSSYSDNMFIFDRSGTTQPFETQYEIEYELMDNKNTTLEDLLDTLRTGRWHPTYESGAGRLWETYNWVAQDNFERWLYETFDLIDEDCDYHVIDGIDMEEMYNEVMGIYFDFISNTPIDLYLAKVTHTLNEKQKRPRFSY